MKACIYFDSLKFENFQWDNQPINDSRVDKTEQGDQLDEWTTVVRKKTWCQI